MNKNDQKARKKGLSKRARQRAFVATYPVANFNVSETCRRIGISRSTYTLWSQTDQKFNEELMEARESRLDELEAALTEQVRNGNITGIIFALKTLGKTRGYIEGSPVKMKDFVPSNVAEILDKVLAGELKPEDAGLELDKMGHPVPEGLRLLIQKTEISTAPSVDVWDQEAVEKELEAKYQEQMAKQDQQRDTWLPGRRDEIQEIKEELKDQDSFSPEAVRESKR